MNTPPSIEVQDFKFVAHSKIQIFENCQVQCSQPNLVCAASRFGLVFTAYQNLVKAIQLSSIIQCSLHDKNVAVRTQQLNGNITYLSLNSDHTVLAILLNINGAFIIQFYDVTSYYKQSILFLNEVRLMCAAKQISWNPCIVNVVAATLEDGSLWACELNGNTFNINTTENNIQATCLSWSPKGKQIVIGTQVGTLSQFKPDLKFVKTINIPDPKGPITSVQWLSNYQFATVFLNQSANAPNVIIVNAPKTGPVVCLNYDEVCYNSREQEPRIVSFVHQPAWSILLVLSPNSTEVGLLGGTNVQDFCSWQQWVLSDDGRAEVPLVGKDESYPCGLALDTGNTNQITIENQTLQPMPMLHLFTDRGILISFDVLNTKPDCPPICCPPEPIRDGSGLSMFVLESTTVQEPVKNIEPARMPVNASIAPNAEQANADFSFLMNKPQVTSTPAKPFGLNIQNNGMQPLGKPAGNLLQNNESNVNTMQAPPNSSASLFLPKPAPLTSSNMLFGAPVQPKVDAAPLNKITQPVENKSNIMQPVSQIPKSELSPAGSDAVDKNEEKRNELEDTAENREAILNLIQTETNSCFKEFKEVMERSRNVDTQLDVELNLLYTGITDLEAFVEEANESTQNQKFKLQILRQRLMEFLSSIERAKKISNGSTSILEHKDLDLLSKNHLSSINDMLYYVQSQITQLNKQIDEQWSDFQENCKVRAKGQMRIPTMEKLYQIMLLQGDILSRQKVFVEGILIKIKEESSAPHRITSSGKITELSSSLKDMSLKSQHFCKVDIEKLLAKRSKFTKEKQQALLRVLSNHKTIKTVADNKPCIVLDINKKIKDKKLTPSNLANKSSDFKTQLNEYMEKQSLLNQQNTEKQFMNTQSSNISSNVSKNLSILFESESKNPDVTISSPGVKTIPGKPQINEANKTDHMISQIMEKPKATNAPILNLSKPITKPVEMTFGNPSVPPTSTFNFASISTSVNNQKTAPISTPASAFSVIKQSSTLNFGEKSDTGEPSSNLVTSTSASVFQFTIPSTSATNISFTKPIATPANQNTKEISFGETPKNSTNLSLSFNLKNDEGKPTDVSSNSLFAFAPKTDEMKNAENVTSNNTFSFAKKTDNIEGKVGSNSVFSFVPKTISTEVKTSENSSTTFSFAKTENNESKPLEMPKALPLNPTKEKIPEMPKAIPLNTTKEKEKEDTVKITPISNTAPVSSSFSFASASTFGQKPVDSNSKPTTTSIFGGNSNQDSENAKTVPATKESNISVTSAHSTFSFNLDALSVSSSNQGLFSNTKESEAVSDLKICSPTSFGNTDPKANTSKQNIFGMVSTNTSTNPVSTSAVTTTASTFGFSSNSMFGESAFGSKMSQASIFGGTSNEDKGSMDSSSSTNIFQQANKTEQSSTSIFGGGSTSTPGAFGSGSVFGQPEKPLGASSTNNLFGNTPKFETNIFGGGPLKPATAMFGQQTTFGTANTFGGSIFGGASANTGNTGFGSPPTTSGGVFGGAPSTGFGSGSSMFGGGAFSSGGGSVAQGGFGSPGSMGKSTPGGFGSPPSFGSTAAPAFGASPTFGSQASFGSPSAFGGAASFRSPTNSFSNVAQPASSTGFTGQAQQSNTFENLASSNVISFGNLAQGSGMPQQAKPSSFTGSSSFSSWR